MDEAQETPEEKARREWGQRLERMFKNIQTMEANAKKKGRDPRKSGDYRRLSAALIRGVTFARDKGWMKHNAFQVN